MLAPRETLWQAHPVLVDAALTMLGVGPGHTLADFGCGDGPALFAAARRGARAVGYEIHVERAAALRAEVSRRGLDDAITIVTGNALDAAFEPPHAPTHVYLYLVARGLRLMLPVLRRLAALQPGGVLPVITLLYSFDKAVPCVATQKVDTSPIARTPMYLYHITAEGGGGDGGVDGEG
jgi:hypothetical protein